MKEVREQALLKSEGRALQAEEVGSAKALRQKHAGHVRGTAGRPACWSKVREREKATGLDPMGRPRSL